MQYLDFDVEIGAGTGRDYPVAVRSPAGETRTSMHFPFDTLALDNYLTKLQNALLRSGGLGRQALSSEVQAVQDFGQRLFAALFADEVGQRYAVSRERALRQTMGVRLRLRIQAPELAALPWEYLYDPQAAEYLCLSRHTPLVRYVELPQPIQTLTVQPPLRILGMLANPRDQATLDEARERERMRRALQDLEAQHIVQLTWLTGQTWRDLQAALQGGPWHVFHFIGHGGFDRTADEGVLALANEQGTTHLLYASLLGRLLANHGWVRLAVLNACEGARGSERDLFSSTAALLVRKGIPAVLAMQEEITDLAAIECTRAFYAALAHGLPIDEAVAEARTAISVGIPDTLEWGTPVLYLRAPDGRLFYQAKKGLKQQAKRTRVESAHTMFPEPFAPQMHQEPTPVQVPSPLSYPTVKVGTTLFTYRGHDSTVNTVAWSPDSTHLASAGLDQNVQICDAATGHKIHTYYGHAHYVSAVVWSPDGMRIASGSWDTTVQVWKAATGDHLLTYRGHAECVSSVAWSPDGQHLASGTGDPDRWGDAQSVQVWDAATGATLLTYHRHSGNVEAVAWSPDGTRLASAGYDKTVQVWDAATGATLVTYRSHFGTVKSVAWSPDGTRLASAGYDKTVQIWDAASGQEIRTCRGHMEWVEAVTWSPDGQYLATGSLDQTVQIWDAATGSKVFTYRGHAERVYTLSWSPDGQGLASGSMDHTVQVWKAPPLRTEEPVEMENENPKLGEE